MSEYQGHSILVALAPLPKGVVIQSLYSYLIFPFIRARFALGILATTETVFRHLHMLQGKISPMQSLAYLFVSNSFVLNLVMTFYMFTAYTNWLRSSDCCVLLVRHSEGSCISCRYSTMSFYFFPIALINIANWKRVGPTRNNPVLCSSSSYSVKLLSGFKAFYM